MNRRRFPNPGSRTSLAVALGSCLYLAAPCSAFAEGSDASAADIAAARTLAVEGVRLAQAGKCDDAVDKLERAEKLHHSPIVLATLGECRIAEGALVEGTEMLRRVLREQLPDHPSAALTKSYERAQSTLDATAPKIGRLTISVSAPGDAELTVTVDGEVVPAALLGAERPTDPGDHTVEATAIGYLKATANVSLGEGEKKPVKLELERDPNAVAPAPARQQAAPAEVESGPPVQPNPSPSAAEKDELPPREESGSNHTAAYVSWIAGGAALAVGAGFGIAAMSGKSDLDKQCNGTVCPSGSAGKLDAAKRNGMIATIGFGVGAAGIALGTVLFFTVGGSSDERPSTALSTRHREPSPRLQASLGLGSVRFAGEF